MMGGGGGVTAAAMNDGNDIGVTLVLVMVVVQYGGLGCDDNDKGCKHNSLHG